MGAQHGNSKSFSRCGKITQIISNQGIGLTVDRRF